VLAVSGVLDRHVVPLEQDNYAAEHVAVRVGLQQQNMELECIKVTTLYVSRELALQINFSQSSNIYGLININVSI